MHMGSAEAVTTTSIDQDGESRGASEPVVIEVARRDGLARALTLARGEDMATTPLLLVRDAALALRAGHGLLADGHDAGPHASVFPTVKILGGFHRLVDGRRDPVEVDEAAALFDGLAGLAATVTAAALEAPVGSESTIIIDRARRIEGLLSLRRRSIGVREAVLDDDAVYDDGVDDVAGRGLPDVVPVISDDGALAVWPEGAASAREGSAFVARLVEARTAAGPARALYAPGIGLPHELAFLVHAGIDVFDTMAVERAALQGLYCTADGVEAASRLTVSPCDRDACADTNPASMSPDEIRTHNIHALTHELNVIRSRLAVGSLRLLVEARVRAHPETTATLRHFDAIAGPLATLNYPLARQGTTIACTQESLSRPDIVRFRERVRTEYLPPAPAEVLLLLPCSARKPYSRSNSHRTFRRILDDVHGAARVHEAMITSPLGIVPRELERVWPAGQYDIPVTGTWDDAERKMIRSQVQALLERGSYKAVVSHLGNDTHELIADLLPEGAVHTGAPHPMRIPARDALRRTLREQTRRGDNVAWPQRRLADMRALASWQFGARAAAVLFAAADDTAGRPPALRAYMGGRRGKQLCAVVPDRGLLALTLDGARVLHESQAIKEVSIDDFMPRGTVFAVGVKDADPMIVPGDEVALCHDGELRGVGVAVSPGPDMVAFARGPCVEVRHHA